MASQEHSRSSEPTPAVESNPAMVHGGQHLPKRANLVIVGNGIAGMTAAIEARRLAVDREILIVTEQNHSTINAPALKQFAIGKLSREQLLAFPEGTEGAHGLHAVRARVEAIDAKNRRLTLSGGFRLGYESLLLATGSTPVGLPAGLPGRDYDGVLVLHRLRDYLDLRRLCVFTGSSVDRRACPTRSIGAPPISSLSRHAGRRSPCIVQRRWPSSSAMWALWPG
jgi:Pyridine nucleotide-disulphide oxidoreductase